MSWAARLRTGLVAVPPQAYVGVKHGPFEAR